MSVIDKNLATCKRRKKHPTFFALTREFFLSPLPKINCFLLVRPDDLPATPGIPALCFSPFHGPRSGQGPVVDVGDAKQNTDRPTPCQRRFQCARALAAPAMKAQSPGRFFFALRFPPGTGPKLAKRRRGHHTCHSCLSLSPAPSNKASATEQPAQRTAKQALHSKQHSSRNSPPPHLKPRMGTDGEGRNTTPLQRHHGRWHSYRSTSWTWWSDRYWHQPSSG